MELAIKASVFECLYRGFQSWSFTFSLFTLWSLYYIPSLFLLIFPAMAVSLSTMNLILCMFVSFTLVGLVSSAKFDELFQPSWAFDHFVHEGELLKLKLDNYSGNWLSNTTKKKISHWITKSMNFYIFFSWNRDLLSVKVSFQVVHIRWFVSN